MDITVKIGGEAGQGIQTVGQLLALTCQQAGLYLMGINDFESRIRGGHNFFQLRLSDKPVNAPQHLVHLLVAIDQKTFDLHREQVLPDGLTLINGEKADDSGPVHPIPIFELAKEAGSLITASTVSAGAALALLGAPFELFEKVIRRQFEGRGSTITEQNLKAAKLGFKAVEEVEFAYAFKWDMEKPKGMLIEGSQSIALGALAGDCRFASYYPMSPATSIMQHLVSYQDRFPLVVEQAEDEIAAVNMIIGASFAGVRAMTATSGGGFCLMTEGVGLAGITETPIVIVNAQRPGPATGLPTRTAQGDLQFVIRAAQDDFPRFVFAPGSPEEAFETAARALTLSEKYQTPAIILVDQFFNDSLYLVGDRFPVPEEIERFIVDKDSSDYDKEYKRYSLTGSGISPRVLPCMTEALVMTSGNEHREDGHISEAISDRNNMVDKRARKVPGMLSEMRAPEAYYGEAKTLLIGWGSTGGIIREAVDLLRNDGVDAGSLHFCDLWPFPSEIAYRALSKAERLIMVEQNSTGQFAQLIRQETGLTSSGNILKYDGRPFYPIEIFNKAKEFSG